jgi:hypothetical protein
VFDLTRVRNLQKTYIFFFCRFFDFLHFRRAGVVRMSRECRAKHRANAISSFRQCFVSHDQCRREPQIPFEISLKGIWGIFCGFSFFFDLVVRSNGWLNTIAYMIRLNIFIYVCGSNRNLSSYRQRHCASDTKLSPA